MTERALIYATALLIVGLSLLAMAGLHDRHYRNRKWQLLESRVSGLEKIVAGEHD